MISVTRRETLLGAGAVPVVAAMPTWDAARPHLLVHDPALSAGRTLAAAHAGEIVAIEGDRVRFARALFARRPSLVIGVTRPADALLLADVGREAGFVPTLAGTGTLDAMIAASDAADKGLVLGWVLAPRA